MQPPAHWEDKAIGAQAIGDWKSAAEYWMKAKGASIGHKRRDRYEKYAERCLDKICDRS